MDSKNSKPEIYPHEAGWSRIAASNRFQHLLAVKKAFIVPAFAFFLAYYLLLPILVGYAPKLMSKQIFGTVTLAYLYALSQFVVGGIIALLYLKASARFDELIQDVIANETSAREENRQEES
jgi:uncharacterized membrane protein (DUF485 family)